MFVRANKILTEMGDSSLLTFCLKPVHFSAKTLDSLDEAFSA